MTATLSRPPIPAVLDQHVEEAAHLRHVRSVLVRAPHVRLLHLARIDERIAAHLDGIAVAGPHGVVRCTAALARAGCGEVFAASVRALEDHDEPAWQRLIAIALAVPEALRGLSSALGWVSAGQLQGTVQALLAQADPARRCLGLVACRLHGVDPGPALVAAMRHDDAGLRREALRCAATLGRIDLLDAVDALIAEPGAATCAALLGGRGVCVQALGEQVLRAGASEADSERAALVLALHAGDEAHADRLLRRLAAGAREAPARQRLLIRACGLRGDVRVIDWLIAQMDDGRSARLAGEAFSMITGADLARLDLERKPPDERPGPSDDPTDTDVAMDADDGLPWPEPQRIADWWTRAAPGLPTAQRVFLGRPLSLPSMHEALRSGHQRQREAAALIARVLQPAARLFPTRAPARRQQRLLAALA